MWTLKRTNYLPDCTLGGLYDNKGIPRMFTLEEPWKDNQHKVSCIPEGIYACKPHEGTKWHRVWEITGVPDRSAILIHSGNTTDDIEGCIIVGRQIGELNNKTAVLQSADALNELRRLIGAGNEFQLTITKETI